MIIRTPKVLCSYVVGYSRNITSLKKIENILSGNSCDEVLKYQPYLPISEIHYEWAHLQVHWKIFFLFFQANFELDVNGNTESIRFVGSRLLIRLQVQDANALVPNDSLMIFALDIFLAHWILIRENISFGLFLEPFWNLIESNSFFYWFLLLLYFWPHCIAIRKKAFPGLVFESFWL